MASNSPLRARLTFTGLALLVCLGCSSGDRPVIESATGVTPVPVRTVAVMQEEVQRRSVQPATVHAYYHAEIRTKVTGYVKELPVDIGDQVAAGDPLLVIDVPELQQQRKTMAARVRRAEAEEMRAAAGVRLAAANIQSAEAKLAQANSEINRAEASLAAAEAEFERTSDLVQRQSLERRMLDEVRMKRDSEIATKQAVASAVLSAEAEVTVAQAKLSSAEADRDVARADTEIVESQLEELDVLLGYTVLKAPFAGVITRRSVDLGDLVLAESQGSKGPSLFSLSQMEKVRVQIPVPEAQAAMVNPGDTIDLYFPSFPSEKSIQASVTRLSGSLDPSTRSMLVEAVIDNTDLRLVPGMFGQATITMGAKLASTVLPARAVRFDETGNAFVYVISDDETIGIVPVTTGIDDGQTIQITTGIEPGQRIVDAHRKRFASGEKVTIVTQ